ncbi:MAG: hypothetical protein P1P85_04175 [Patescibacteria group bacterium]|nr:hypothetical protein [Patescibacteria group bacterium]
MRKENEKTNEPKKHKWHFPEEGQTVEAESYQEALKIIKRKEVK